MATTAVTIDRDEDVSLLALPSFDACIVTDAPEQQQHQQRKRTSNDDDDDDDHQNRHTFPFVLSPPTAVANGVTMIDTSEKLTNFIQVNSNRIDTIVNEQCGAILFRGFPSLVTKENNATAADNFNTFVESFDDCLQFQDLSYDKSMSFAVRTKIMNRICTTNEGKSGGLVFHHEQAQTPLWPSHVFFCCELPAAKNDGGETGIVSSITVYEKLQQLYPTFINKLETIGIQYTIYSGITSDSTKGSGRSWKSFFHVTTKNECELKMKAGGWTYEWGVGPSGTIVDKNFLKCTTPILEGVKTMKNGQKCFFNQLIATTANALEFSKVGSNTNRNESSSGGGSNSNDNGIDIDNGYNPLIDIPTQDGINECVKFSNGDQIDLDILLTAKDICEEYSVNIQWEKGDICLLSNYLCMHARRIWSGPIGTRKLLASLVQENNCTSFNQKLIV
ncbi:hypothetical protein FRACYDRAFT_270908 [Fragilariopsis cylindrus CCMP1102]|uniref:TauD/TfdA-like domain-containing protein n=1 Tax=Fragilariopsis cylindrus CCMP1102 TaxID=635003 RepID=A0A1E7EYN1_9STRA|nr:hypothetical protein FRACYDRAFT_270908 [Fragilariopsis cylindrus CCMP1102]|eukprot:OEU11022.1 hypothetical protein FRACYDRAFT_270908 [Fragilariopsis cylindrus CCMP1102]